MPDNESLPKSDERASSWAQRIGDSVAQINKNILEVILEKDVKGAFSVSDVDCARLLTKLGLDLRPGLQVEGVQLCPNGRGVILITLKDSINIEQFCRYDVIQVTSSGIRSVLVKPAGKRDALITIRGIHPNTKDSTVLKYLAKFGKIPQPRVVYGRFNDGPLKGMLNGDRQYKMEIKSGINIGSYHLIDNVKVNVRYLGQQQTCGRCHKMASNCKGGGVAKKCEAQGGLKLDFMDYIKDLWKEIDYYPDNFNESEEYEDVSTTDMFTPQKSNSFPVEKFNGVCVKQIPKDTDHGEIIEFLSVNGLPDDKIENVQINSSGAVFVNDLDSYIIEYLIETIHGKTHFGRKLYCNGVVPLTPSKPEEPSAAATVICSTNSALQDQSNILEQAKESLAAERSVNINSAETLEINNQSIDQLVRRHSLSLKNRTPPQNSLAADLLNTPRENLEKTANIIGELKSMTDRLSDFASCISSDSDDLETNDEKGYEFDEFKTVTERRRQKRNKRKQRSPIQEKFQKKPYLATVQ